MLSVLLYCLLLYIYTKNGVIMVNLRLVQVQGRDGSSYEFVLPEDAVPRAAVGALRLKPPDSLSPSPLELELAGAAASFLGESRDASNLMLTYVDPDGWMELEATCRAGRAAVAESECWSTAVMAGHSLRFPPGGRKAAYVRHRRSVWRVAKAFQV